MFRTKEALIPYLLLVAAAAGGLLWYQTNQQPGLGRVVSTGTAQVGGPFTLTGPDGKRVSSSDFRGRYMLIYFGYSFCPDVCPTTLAVMSEALDKAGPAGRRVVPIFITIDPERDTPKVLSDYLKAFGPQFVGLTGSVDEIKAVEKLYRVYAVKEPLDNAKGMAGGYGMNHSNVLYLMGPDGKLVSYYSESISPDDLTKELRKRV